MTTRTSHVGFSLIEVIVVVAIVALVAFLGYSLYTHQQAATNDKTSSAQVAVPAAPEITSASDLDTASNTLDQIDVDGSNSTDSTRLDSELSAF